MAVNLTEWIRNGRLTPEDVKTHREERGRHTNTHKVGRRHSHLTAEQGKVTKGDRRMRRGGVPG